MDALLEIVKQAKKPFIYAGGGIIASGAEKEVLELSKRLNAPVGLSMMGLTAIPASYPLNLGMCGMHGKYEATKAQSECDLLLAVGVRFSDRATGDKREYTKKCTTVHIDIDRAEINKNVRTDHHIVGDAKRVLKKLTEIVAPADHSDWKKYVFSFKTETEYDEGGETLTPKQILSSIAKLLPEDTVVATDVGQHQLWAIQHFRFDYPGQLLTSGGFGTMGFGLGAAIGAKVGNPEKTVIHITGDGSFRMNCNELATVQNYGVPIITFVFNNKTLGMVRQWQTLIYDKRYSETNLEGRAPDFVKLAEAYGLSGAHVTNVAELEAAIKEAMACGHGYIIDCAIDIDEKVRPMVGGGSHITDFLLS